MQNKSRRDLLTMAATLPLPKLDNDATVVVRIEVVGTDEVRRNEIAARLCDTLQANRVQLLKSQDSKAMNFDIPTGSATPTFTYVVTGRTV